MPSSHSSIFRGNVHRTFRSLMELIIISFIVAISGCNRVQATPFVLDQDFVVSNIERTISLPSGAHAISTYRRYYAVEGETSKNPIVTATFVHDASEAGIFIVDRDEMPVVLDGGCDVIEVRYSVTSRSILSMECNGEA